MFKVFFLFPLLVASIVVIGLWLLAIVGAVLVLAAIAGPIFSHLDTYLEFNQTPSKFTDYGTN